MNKICGIYKITSPSGKIYIGQSRDINRRLRDYKNLRCKGQIKLYNSLIKHGWDTHTFEIILECEELILNDLEAYYIKLFNTFDTEFGLNLTSGGNHSKLSEETKRKIGLGNKGKKVSEETKLKISNINKANKYSVGRICSNETRIKIGLGNKGKKISEETKLKLKNVIVSDITKQKISNSLKGNERRRGKKLSEETKRKISDGNKNKIRTEETKLKLCVAQKIEE